MTETEADRELLADLSGIIYGSILYVNCIKSDSGIVGVFTEVLSETIVALLENVPNPFEAFDNYKINYDDILSSTLME